MGSSPVTVKAVVEEHNEHPIEISAVDAVIFSRIIPSGHPSGLNTHIGQRLWYHISPR
jgi:hypothetical protein